MRLLREAVKWALGIVLALFFFLVPLPRSVPSWAGYVQWGIGSLIAVCIVGKLLYDTLFYNRYRP